MRSESFASKCFVALLAWLAALCLLPALAVAEDAPVSVEGESATGGEAVDPWREYIEGGDWRGGERHYRGAIVEACSAGARPGEKAIRDLHFAHAVCREFQSIEGFLYNPALQERFAGLLLSQPDFTGRFLLALQSRDDRRSAFKVLYDLLRKHGNAVFKHPNLAIAFAVVWDTGADDADLLADSFGYFVRYRRAMRFDFEELPVEILKFVVDLRRPVEERLWALNLYGQSANVGRLYSIVKYDARAFTRGAGRRAVGEERSLESIRKEGGVCHDRAVFASAVGKSAGVPTVYIAGRTGSGIGHAWIGFLRKRGQGYAWDKESGRIGDARDASGEVVDPQTGATVSEHELDFALAALDHPLAKRRAAIVWRDVAGILADAGEDAAAARAMDKSFDVCVFDKSQWQMFARLTRKMVFGDQQVIEAAENLRKSLSGYPDLAVDAFGALVDELRGVSAVQRVRMHRELAASLSRHKEAVARVRLMEGRFLEAVGDPSAALEVYANGAMEALGNKVEPMDLLDNAGRLLVENRMVGKAIEIHLRARAKAGSPRRSAFAIYTAPFQIGLRIAKLHQLAGESDKHSERLDQELRYYSVERADQAAMRDRLARLEYGWVNRTRAPEPVKIETR